MTKTIRLNHVLPCVLSTLFIVGCTRGKVLDESGDEVGGAAVQLYEYPHPNQTNPGISWSTAWSADHSVTSNSQTFQSYNYGFDESSAECYSGDGVANSRVATGWHRQEIRKSGYDPYITYFRHTGYFAPDGVDCIQYAKDPSTGDCEQFDGTCHNLPDAKLYTTSSSAVDQYHPDLVPDVRDLDVRRIDCAWKNGISGDPDVVALRFNSGAANVGGGELRIESGVDKRDSCSGAHNCPSSFTCSSSPTGSVCVPPTCTVDADCPGDLGLDTCDNGYCSTALCSSDSQCSSTSGECLIPGTCPLKRDSAEGIGCSTECPAPGLLECVAGTCQHVTCTSDSDCNPDDVCWQSEGICVQPADSCTNFDDTACPGQCQLESQGNCVPQVYQTYIKEGGVVAGSEHLPDAEFDFDPDHQHTHLGDFTEVAIYSDDAGCADTEPENRDASWWASCGIGPGNGSVIKQSFCIVNTTGFDTEIENEFAHGSRIIGTTCGPVVQQLQAGWKDVYTTETTGQYIVLDSNVRGEPGYTNNYSWPELNALSQKNVWIEAVVDPTGVLSERSTYNNRARTRKRLPSLSTSTQTWTQLCDLPLRDCSGVSSSPDHQEPCNDYF